MNWKILLAAVTALGVNSFAQGGFILRGGLNLANVTYSTSQPGVDESFRPGFNAAAMGDIPINNNVHVLLGGGFETKGGEQSGGDGGGGTATETLELNYITIPIMLSLQTPLSSQVSPTSGPRFFVNAGVEPAFLVSSNIEVDDQGQSQSEDISSNTAPFDISLTGELGFKIPFSPTVSGIVGGGYSYGLINWDTEDGDAASHNYVIKFFVGLEFNSGIAPR